MYSCSSLPSTACGKYLFRSTWSYGLNSSSRSIEYTLDYLSYFLDQIEYSAIAVMLEAEFS